MPTRLIREGIINSDRINELDWAGEVFYRRLLNKVDDHGLYDARPSVLRTSLYPLRVDRVREADCSRWLAMCEKAGLIVLYEADNKPYLKVLDTRWQTRSEPKYPEPPTVVNNGKQVKTPVPVVVVEDVVEVVEKPLSGKPDDPPGFVKFWNAWPRSNRKQGRAKCLVVWKRKGLESKADAIVAHVAHMAKTEGWQTGFDPMPETYLNKDRWDGADLTATGVAKPWEDSWSGIVSKGAELGVFQDEGESGPDFKARVMTAAKEIA